MGCSTLISLTEIDADLLPIELWLALTYYRRHMNILEMILVKIQRNYRTILFD